MKSLVTDQAGCLEDTPLLPQRLLGGGRAELSPFRRSLRSLPPLLGLAPCDRGDAPPRLPQLICGSHKRAKSGSIPGFALLSLLEGLRSLFRAKRGIFFAPRHARSAFPTVFSTPSLIHFIPRICGCFHSMIFFYL